MARPPRSGVRGAPDAGTAAAARRRRPPAGPAPPPPQQGRAHRGGAGWGAATAGAAPPLQQHGRALEGGHGVGDAAPGDVGRGAVDGLEQAPAVAEVGRGGQPQAAPVDAGHIREDVAEEVGRHHHVEAGRLLGQPHSRHVHQQLLHGQVGVVAGHGQGRLAEQPVADPQDVGLVHDGHAAGPPQLGGAAPGQLAGRPGDARRGAPRDHPLGDGGVAAVLRALAPGVQPLGVLAHDHQVDARALRRPDVRVQVELAAQAHDRAAVAGHGVVGRGDGAEEGGVRRPRGLEGGGGQGVAVALEGGPAGLGLDQLGVRRKGAQGPNGGRQHLRPDPVAGDDADAQRAPRVVGPRCHLAHGATSPGKRPWRL